MTPGFRRLFAFGTGAGIEIAGQDLEIAVARVRPHGIQVLGRTAIARFRDRPAAQWGAEYAEFLRKLGAGYLSATVLLPRHDTIVRQILLRGVEAKDVEAAIAFQLDTLHPYGDEEVLFGWNPLTDGAVLVGIVRRETVERYLELFSEAGITTGSFTFAAAAIHAAIRLAPAPRAGFVALSRNASGTVEVYGESQARPAFWAEFDLPAEKAAALAAAELRLEPDTPAVQLESLLPAPRVNPVENDVKQNPMPYITALAGACPRLTPSANLLPPGRRAPSSRAVLIPTAALAAALMMLLGASLAWSSFEQRQYLKKLEAEIGRLEPQARRAAALDRQTGHMRARTRLLDEFRGRTRSDLEALNELTRVLQPPVWASTIELSRDAAVINGEAEQAAPLVKALDGSPLFHNSEFSGISKVGTAELFRLRTQRRARK